MELVEPPQTIFEKAAARVRLARARKGNDRRPDDTRKSSPPKQVVARTGKSINPRSVGNPIACRGVVFPSRLALARHLAPLLGRSVGAVMQLLVRHNDDVEAVLNYARKRIGKRGQTADNFPV
jgi:hypothetical protein